MWCGACVGSCPKNAITLHETMIEVDDELCIRCGICTRICPVGALTLEEEAC
jgi:ferredoxin